MRVVAAEHEINRVARQLSAVEQLLARVLVEAELMVLLEPTPQHLLLLAQLPIWLVRLRYLQFCLWVSAQSYFTVEGQVRNLMHQFLPGVTQELSGVLASKELGSNQFRVGRVGETKVTSAPGSLRTMLNRLQTTALLANGTLRIESWFEGGKRHFIIYLPGTQDWAPVAGENPLNLSSDLQAFAHSKSDTQSALLLALKKAGATPGDEVIFVAHSQGGLVAANFAQHPSGFNVSTILSFAGPMVAVGALSKTKVLAFEHTNDPMPYLAGKANPLAANWVTVQATAAASGMAAHELSSYGPMTSLADKSNNAAIAGARTNLLARLKAKRVKVQFIKLKRSTK